MSLKNVVVEGCQFEIYEGGLLNTSGVVSVDNTPVTGSVVSKNTKVDGKGVYTTLKVTVSGFTANLIPNWIPLSGSTTTPAGVSVPGVFQSSALYNKVDGDAVFLEGDQAAAVTIYGKVQAGQSTVDTPTVVSIKVKSGGAGQDKMKAE